MIITFETIFFFVLKFALIVAIIAKTYVIFHNLMVANPNSSETHQTQIPRTKNKAHIH